MNKVLIVLPDLNDLAEAAKLDKSKYEVHILHASKEASTKKMTVFDHGRFLAQPDFLTSYVERAVSYVNEHGITAIMYGDDISSIAASVVCQETGIRGPTLNSTFCCLHKYYSRVTDETDIWFDYIHLDQPEKSWQDKVRYPCFLKATVLNASRGNSIIFNKEQMAKALINLKELVKPYFIGYSQFFRKYLDLKKFPLAVENIALVEEFIQDGVQYSFEGWVDEDSKFAMHSTGETLLSKHHRDIILAFVVPQFTSDNFTMIKFEKVLEKTSKRFGLRNTFIGFEFWKRKDKFTLIEINPRIPLIMSESYWKLFGESVYEQAAYLACGEMEKLRQHVPAITHHDGQIVSGLFLVPTRGEGKGKSFIDYEYARSGCITDGVYTNVGPGLLLNFEEDSVVKQTSTSGVRLCRFLLSDTNLSRLVQRATKIMKKLILRSEDMDIIQFSAHNTQFCAALNGL